MCANRFRAAGINAARATCGQSHAAILAKYIFTAINIIIESLTPIQTEAEEFGLAEFFYLPHSFLFLNTDKTKNMTAEKTLSKYQWVRCMN